MKGFPFVLGTDIVHLLRWDQKQNPTRIVRLAQRFLHSSELELLHQKRPDLARLLQPLREPTATKSGVSTAFDRASETSISAAEYYATQLTPQMCKAIKTFLGGRWAAKEAAMKAWGADIIGFKDLRVVSDSGGDSLLPESDTARSGPLKIVCQPDWKASLDTDQEPSNISQMKQEGCLSISHDGDYAVATVIAEPLNETLRAYLSQMSRKVEEHQKGLKDKD